uniref:Uncharacterized protein n=2 Tax=Rhodnius prolixus TaxID=13249 RepID=T1HSE9_RHOPR
MVYFASFVSSIQKAVALQAMETELKPSRSAELIPVHTLHASDQMVVKKTDHTGDYTPTWRFLATWYHYLFFLLSLTATITGTLFTAVCSRREEERMLANSQRKAMCVQPKKEKKECQIIEPPEAQIYLEFSNDIHDNLRKEDVKEFLNFLKNAEIPYSKKKGSTAKKKAHRTSGKGRITLDRVSGKEEELVEHVENIKKAVFGQVREPLIDDVRRREAEALLEGEQLSRASSLKMER